MTVEVGNEVTGQLDRPWQPMIGSEHLSYLLSRDRTGGRVIGAELREALRIARDELGVRAVRAHGILCDDLGVYREGRPPDFSGVDRVYDELMSLGLRPVVELSFMPRDLARDPDRTVFSYQAVISPPADWDRWGDLCAALASHLVQRYGADEVTGRWAFEVWNEPNLDVFWSGTQQEYFRLYDVSARAVKSVHPGLRVGGPASAAAAWTRELMAHTDASGAPLDFLSSHVYGNVPVDLRARELPVCGLSGAPPRPISTGSATPSSPRRSCSAAWRRRWAGSRPCRTGSPRTTSRSSVRRPSCSTGGSGCCRWETCASRAIGRSGCSPDWGGTGCGVQVRGDGAGGLVQALAARHDDGRTGILVWNGTLDQGKTAGDARLDREILLRVLAPLGASYTVRHYRIDAEHSNIVPAWEKLRGGGAWPRGGGAWPRGGQWRALRELNTLDELVPPARVTGGLLELAFELPMPGVSYLELAP